MQLFIKTLSQLCMEISNVTLMDGFIPAVEDERLDFNATDLEKYEEIWYKVLILDSISIDCKNKSVKWNCDSVLPIIHDVIKKMNDVDDLDLKSMSDHKQITNGLYVGGEFYGYESSIDTLFSCLEDLIPSIGSGNTTLKDFQKEVLMLLHRYILPVIQLEKEDTPLIDKALYDQETQIQEITDCIENKCDHLEFLQASLSNKMISFIENDLDELKSINNNLPNQFLEVLISDLQTYLFDCSKIHNHTGNLTFSNNLESLNLTLNELQNFQNSHRQKFRKAFHNSFLQKSQNYDLNPKYNSYMELHHMIKEVNKDRNEMICKKLRVVNVKAALHKALEQFSLNESINFASLESISISKQIDHILSDKSHKITKKHLAFCSQVNNTCKGALFEKQMIEMTTGESPVLKKSPNFNKSMTDKQYNQDNLDNKIHKNIQVTMIEQSCSEFPLLDNEISQPITLSLIDEDCNRNEADYPSCCRPLSSTSNFPKDSIIQLEGRIGNEGMIIIHDTDKNHLKSALEKLKDDIKRHFKEITRLISRHLCFETNSAKKNIWLAYESHFYEAAMSNLIRLYKNAYSNICENLCENLQYLSASDLNLRESIVSTMLQNILDSSSDEDKEDCNSNKLSHCEHNLLPIQSTSCSNIPPTYENDTSLSSQNSNNFQVEFNATNIQSILVNSPNFNSCYDLETSDCTRDRSSTSVTDNSNCEETGNIVKRVKIHYPSSITVLYNRRTWPLPSTQCESNDVEYATDALILDLSSPSSSFSDQQWYQNTHGDQPYLPVLNPICNHNPTNRDKSLALQERYRNVFENAMQCINSSINNYAPLRKMQHLTSCLREINTQVTQLQKQQLNAPIAACSDDLIDMLIVLLLNSNVQQTSELYAHIMLLIDLIAPFFDGGPYDFSLVQFSVAFQYLQERVIIKKRFQMSEVHP